MCVEVTATEGQDIQLLCPENMKNSSVIWSKKQGNGSHRIVFRDKVQPDFADHMSYDKASGNLTIHKVRLNDSGVYWCAVGFYDPHRIHLRIVGKFQHHINTGINYVKVSILI